jgi:hypothetical protein
MANLPVSGWTRVNFIRVPSAFMDGALPPDGGIEFGCQALQIEPVSIGCLLQRIEQSPATDTFPGATVPCPEHGFGGPVTTDDIQYRHSGINARLPFFSHLCSSSVYRIEINRDISGKQIAINNRGGQCL